MELVSLGRPEIDMEVPGSVAAAIKAAAPDVVINAGAYTAVDKAEDEPQRAFRINADGAGEVAAAARAAGAPIIQISTDYVFDGTSKEPYREDSSTRPLGVYGQSKLAGEEQVRAASDRHLIVRTAWVYSPWRRNFVTSMLRMAQERNEVRVVDDQHGSPTSALDLAEALLQIADCWGYTGRATAGGTYHFAGAGRCSWADLAEEIFRVSTSIGGPAASVVRVRTAEFPAGAKRPANSILDCSKFEREFGFRIPPWQAGVRKIVERLIGKTKSLPEGGDLAGE